MKHLFKIFLYTGIFLVSRYSIALSLNTSHNLKASLINTNKSNALNDDLISREDVKVYQGGPNFLGCSFGIHKDKVLKYFQDNLNGTINEEYSKKDTIYMSVEGFVGFFKTNSITLYFNNNTFFGGSVSFDVSDNIKYENKSKLLSEIKNQILNKYPGFVELKKSEFLFNYDPLKKISYLNKSWLIEMYESFFSESVYVEMYDNDLLTEFIRSKSSKIDF